MDLLTLSKIQSLSISLEELKENRDKSYKYILGKSTHIEVEYKDILEEFYSSGMMDPDLMGDYNLCPEYGTSTSNYRFRFMIVSLNASFVLVPLKVVDPRSADIENYISISYNLISLRNSNADILCVAEVLMDYHCIKNISVICSESDDFHNNNYFNMIDDFRNMDRSAWRSKRGVNKLSKILSFNVFNDDMRRMDLENEISAINTKWNEVKGEDSSDKSDIKLVEMSVWSRDIDILEFRYNGILIAYSIVIDSMHGRYKLIESTKTISVADEVFISEYLKCDDMQIVGYIKEHLSSFVQYHINKFCLEDSGSVACYYYGDVRCPSGLRYFKKRYYKHEIYYQRVSLDEYIGTLKEDEDE